jgi:hypothetical protein
MIKVIKKAESFKIQLNSSVFTRAGQANESKLYPRLFDLNPIIIRQ